jgi:di/tripeptidase
MLGLGNSLVSGYTGGWSPTDEGGSLVAWYKKGARVTAAVSNKVTLWENQEGTTGYDMVQDTATNQPTFDATTGAVVFDGVDNFLKMTGQITLATTFTIGIKFNVETVNTILLADDSTGNEMIKVIDTDTIRVKAAEATESPISVTANLNLSEGTFDADSYIVITRDGSGNMGFWHKGVDQSTGATLSVDYGVDIDAMGRRQGSSPNYFDGDIFDVAIFNTANSTLTEQLNLYLSGL